MAGTAPAAPGITRTRKGADGSHAGVRCPCCDRDLAAGLVVGEQRCPGCGSLIEAAVFAPPRDPGPVVLPSGTSTPCARHARNLAESSCQRCGAFMCALCRVSVDGMELCTPCFDRLEREGALPSARRSVRNYNGMAFNVSLYGICFFYLGLLIGPLVIHLAVRGMRQNRRLGERISVAAGWFALAMGVLHLLVGALILVVLLRVLGER